MKIALLAFGTRGDVQPFVTLGRRLRARGHDVHLGTTPAFRTAARDAGLGFRPVSPPPGVADDTYRPEMREAISKGPSMLRYMSTIPYPTSAQRAELLTSLERAVEDVDLMITETSTHVAGLLDPGPKWCAYSPVPITPTREFPAFIGPQVRFGRTYNWLTHRIADGLWYIGKGTVREYLRTTGRSRPRGSSRHNVLGRTVPLLYGFSQAIVPRPADWPRGCHITGFWIDDRPWSPDPELEKFVSTGPAPVVLTIGSAWPVFPEYETVDAAMAAARLADRPLVIVGGPEREFPPDVLRRTEVSFGWLFPRAATVIHAATLGATAHSVQAGVPQVTLPAAFDQPFWATRIHALGVGARPVPRSKFSADALAHAVESTLRDERMRDRAKAVANCIRHEDGVAVACDIIENTFEAGESGLDRM